MSRLFIEIYLDEDVDVAVAQLLRRWGFDAVTTQETRPEGRSPQKGMPSEESRRNVVSLSPSWNCPSSITE